MDFDFKIKLAFVLFMGLIMSACASRPVPHGDFVKDRDTAAKVVIYIPHSEWKGLAVERRFFVDGAYVGSLNRGEEVVVFVPEGQRLIEMKPYFFGIQDGKAGTILVDTTPGEEYFIRFSFDNARTALLPTGAGGIVPYVMGGGCRN